MYHQPHDRVDDPEELLAFMRANSFATVVTGVDGGAPNATHVPLSIAGTGEAVVITGHVSKANPQWRDFDGREALAIFQAPHAYVAPRNYESELNVPTWNYVAVHASGPVVVDEDRAAKMDQLRALIRQFDGAYEAQFDSLPTDWVEAKLKGIVALELRVTKLEGRWKLSQNRTGDERARVIADLAGSADAAARETARLMGAAQLRAGGEPLPNSPL